MKHRAKTGPPVTRKDGHRVEIYVPNVVLRLIDQRCRQHGQRRQGVILSILTEAFKETPCTS